MRPALNLPHIIFECGTTGFAHRCAEHISRRIPTSLQCEAYNVVTFPTTERPALIVSAVLVNWVGFIYLFISIVFISKNVEREITDCLNVTAPDANSDTSRIKFSLKMDMLAICRSTYRSDLPCRSTLWIT